MFVERLEAHGFRHLPSTALSFSRFEAIDGAPLAMQALHDALLIPLAPVDPDVLRDLIRNWRAQPIDLAEAGGLANDASWNGGEGLGGLFSPDGDGLVRVSATYRLDPVLFGKLRASALRDPRLVDAMSGDATLSITCGLRFDRDFRAVGLDVLRFAVGEVTFPTSGPDAPSWLPSIWRALRGRTRGLPLSALDWHPCASSWSAETQNRLRETLGALAGPPARLGELVPLESGLGLLDGDALVPLHFLGLDKLRAAGWVGAALLRRPDILVARDAPCSAPWQRWWRAQVEAENSPLEQVILLGVPRGRPPGA
ncbi:MAG: hypothetical protein FJ090_15650 [Deltaproteobacteria bacterium]|nr:hypothetical protein [Deltaproteobacteria bacterium]